MVLGLFLSLEGFMRGLWESMLWLWKSNFGPWKHIFEGLWGYLGALI